MRKRLIPIMTLVILCALLYGCMGHVKPGARVIDATGDYSELEIRQAMAAITRRFRLFPGCTMTELRYDGDAARDAQREWAERSGSEEAIVLDSLFHTGPMGDPVMEPDEDYAWSWILVRNRYGPWRLYTYGYG